MTELFQHNCWDVEMCIRMEFWAEVFMVRNVCLSSPLPFLSFFFLFLQFHSIVKSYFFHYLHLPKKANTSHFQQNAYSVPVFLVLMSFSDGRCRVRQEPNEKNKQLTWRIHCFLHALIFYFPDWQHHGKQNLWLNGNACHEYGGRILKL